MNTSLEFIILLYMALLWLRRRQTYRRHSILARNNARRARLRRFILMQQEESACFLALMQNRVSDACLSRRTIWKKNRNQSFLRDIAMNWSDKEWKQNFRITRETYCYLCDKLQPYLQKQLAVREPLSVAQGVAITLWRLGTNVEYRTISHLFGIGLSTVCVVVHEVSQVIVEQLIAQYICVSSGQGLKRIVNGFQSKWGFPQCVGEIDGTHIPIISPKEHPLYYYNRKGYHSVILQALVDHEYKFLDIYVGWPGSVHDARVLANSALYSRCERGNFLPNWQKTISRTNVPLQILGDPAYPLKSWLMKPFSETGLSGTQRTFNYRLSRARVAVENAFGRLKGRWLSLMKRNDSDIKSIPTLVAACCVLYNLCETHGDGCEQD